MKKYSPAQLLHMLAVPVLTVLLGLILLFSPDTASTLVGKLLAWCCILAAVALGAGVFLGAPNQRSSRITWATICFAAGVWMLLNPLTVAKFLGRVLGITLMIRGGQSIGSNLQYHSGKPVISSGLVIAAVTVLVGAVLVILPMASSRMLFPCWASFSSPWALPRPSTGSRARSCWMKGRIPTSSTWRSYDIRLHGLKRPVRP